MGFGLVKFAELGSCVGMIKIISFMAPNILCKFHKCHVYLTVFQFFLSAASQFLSWFNFVFFITVVNDRM